MADEMSDLKLVNFNTLQSKLMCVMKEFTLCIFHDTEGLYPEDIFGVIAGFIGDIEWAETYAIYNHEYNKLVIYGFRGTCFGNDEMPDHRNAASLDGIELVVLIWTVRLFLDGTYFKRDEPFGGTITGPEDIIDGGGRGAPYLKFSVEWDSDKLKSVIMYVDEGLICRHRKSCSCNPTYFKYVSHLCDNVYEFYGDDCYFPPYFIEASYE